jgi:7-cyano-7-deazaguanine reductase
MPDPKLANAPLGHEVTYPKKYDAGLLFPITRAANRQTLQEIPAWTGEDIWNAYEISWLNLKGKPLVWMGRFTFAHDSANLIESKSFKLYLNSFNEERFDSAQHVQKIMQRDLSEAAQSSVAVELFPASTPNNSVPLQGRNIDGADIEITTYKPAPELLRCTASGDIVTETLTSDLLKSNCPVTGQPDWGSLQIRYTGPRIDTEALLAYVVSLRQHNEFHEHCVEKMYCDIWNACRPTSLFVYARYTRRGGLDINPWRASGPVSISQVRTPRQ